MFVHGPQLISDGQIETLRGLLVGLGDVAKTNPACALAWGWCDYIGGRYSQAEKWVNITHDLAPVGFDQTITAPLRMNISVARGDVGSALALARSIGRSDLVLPAVLLGSLGNALGTFLGFWAAGQLLPALLG